MSYTVYSGDSSGLMAAFGAGMMIYSIVMLAISILTIVSMWKLFTKAEYPGWAAIVPFYNIWVLFEIVYGNGAKMFLLLIPFANFVFMIMLYIELAKCYGKDTGFGIGLVFLSPIFLPMLAFGNNEYLGYVEK